MSHDLKQCPFCGRTPTVEDCGTNRWFVRCKCGIAQDKLYAQKCDAVRAWNRRKFGIIKDVPSVQTETSTDFIDRRAAVDAVRKAVISAEQAYAVDALNGVPSVQPEQQLITWLLDEIWDDDAWELNYAAFPEILCRKLVKLGYIAIEGEKYVRVDKSESGD